ncbi:MAG: radical SAM family heme chaperone HemW, partial [Butyricicoccus sp.]|nr:radical SAM family heme chaperone HemW [Butyricicoccus sp.]
MKNKSGLYLHVPFCASKCRYCDFYSYPPCADEMDAYTDALCRSMADWADEAAGESFDTVYLGGGTPSLLGADRLTRILCTAQERFALAPDTEITVECNPDSMTDELLDGLRQAGANRLSVGIQSAHDDELKMLGRCHTFAEAAQAVARARAHGFDNLSLDLMYGLPGQTAEKFLQSVSALLDFSPEHLSCYGLKLEPNTPMGRENPTLPEDDVQADLYLALCKRLGEAGFEHYEISNWAQPHRRSRHNSKYWDLTPYLGIGPGAHSLWRDKRFAYPRSTADFLAGCKPVPEEETPDFPAWAEYLMLSLRTADGIDGDTFTERFGMDFAPFGKRLHQLAASGLTEEQTGGWRL